MAEITIHEPTRQTMRMIFELAMGAAKLQGTLNDIQIAAQWHEYLWQARDQAAKTKDEKPKEEINPPAVVTDGIDSAKAEARRLARREKRLAEKSARESAKEGAKASKEPPGQEVAEAKSQGQPAQAKPTPKQ